MEKKIEQIEYELKESTDKTNKQLQENTDKLNQILNIISDKHYAKGEANTQDIAKKLIDYKDKKYDKEEIISKLNNKTHNDNIQLNDKTSAERNGKECSEIANQELT
jgi:hypothetical protein